MIEFIPDIFQSFIPLFVGLIAIFLYTKSKKLGLALIGVAFLLSAVPSIVNIALGGPYLSSQLVEQGYTTFEIGVFFYHLFLLRSAFQIVFAILVLAGLVTLSGHA